MTEKAIFKKGNLKIKTQPCKEEGKGFLCAVLERANEVSVEIEIIQQHDDV
jgi:hypothetical protein